MTTEEDRITGQDLLAWLQKQSKATLKLPVGTTGHYGEFHEMELPTVRTAKKGWDSSPHLMVIAFPTVDVGPEPD